MFFSFIVDVFTSSLPVLPFQFFVFSSPAVSCQSTPSFHPTPIFELNDFSNHHLDQSKCCHFVATLVFVSARVSDENLCLELRKKLILSSFFLSVLPFIFLADVIHSSWLFHRSMSLCQPASSVFASVLQFVDCFLPFSCALMACLRLPYLSSP